MSKLISVPEAAKALNLDPSRIRVLAAQGALPAVRIGSRWAIDEAGVVERLRHPRPVGRPLAAHNAWALLALASGEDVDWVGGPVRSRLRRSLKDEGLGSVAPRLVHRAEVKRYRSHPGEIPRLVEDLEFVASGISAATAVGADLVAGVEADGYVRQSSQRALVKRHALREAQAGEAANVKLRVVQNGAWHLAPPIAYRAAVALDLAEEGDARSRKAGEALIEELERPWR